MLEFKGVSLFLHTAFFTISDNSLAMCRFLGSGRLGNRPSGRVGFGSGIALQCIPRVGNFLVNFEVIDLVEKILVVGVLGHAESKSGLHFVFRAMIHC